MAIDAGRLGRICAERDAAHSILKQLVPDPAKEYVGTCANCACPILHLEHLELNVAQVLEAAARAVIEMGVTDPWGRDPL